ncbi:dihydrolipoyl dehydrogenase [Actinomycetes bacterium M1A6_2h]
MTMSEPTSYDLVVLGGGSGGYAAALRAAELGLRVALVEKGKLGGTCLHRGCIPTKALLQTADVVDTVKKSETFGVSSTFGHVDLAVAATYRDGVVAGLFRGLTGLVKGRGIEVVAGTGTLSTPTTVDVTLLDGTARTLTGRAVVIATGSVPRNIRGIDVDHTRILTSDDALTLAELPQSVVILGAGAIGCEFATVWRSFGAEVTIVEALPRLVPLEEESSSKALASAFTRAGIRTSLGVKVASAKSGPNGAEVRLGNGETLTADVVLVAIGRAPVTDDLGLEQIGVEVDRGYIKVDDHCRTSVPTVFAVGDVIPTLQLAHVGFAEGILVAEVIAGLETQPIDYSGVPRITYSHPEVASVGLTTATAIERGYDVVESTYDLAGNGKARILGTSGSVKVIAAKDGPVLGVHMVGARVGEMIAEAQLIVNWEAQPGEVAQHIHAHPTMSEAVGEAHLALAGKPLHNHG